MDMERVEQQEWEQGLFSILWPTFENFVINDINSSSDCLFDILTMMTTISDQQTHPRLFPLWYYYSGHWKIEKSDNVY